MTLPSQCSAIEIEVFYFEDCPHHPATIDRIHEVLREEGCEAKVRAVPVPDAETAQRVGFLGSPTVRVNGIDIEPGAGSRRDFGLMCRRYTGGAPSAELIRSAIRLALEAEGRE